VQFVINGPDVPDSLLQLHADGQVVFFCGAGISRPAELPDFKGLTERLFEDFGVPDESILRRALTECQYDRAIGLLEADLPRGAGRLTVRKKIAEILLKANTDQAGATQTHRSLLALGKAGDDKTRLVTTNFDRIFEFVIQRDACNLPRFSAPLLPLPKTRWNGLVYLHGLLTAPPTDEALENLVVSSGDFGLAYLTERWASVFVSELFRNFNVCFVGYSLSDPVLRYMTDALAADAQRGENPREMFAFSHFEDGKEEECRLEWRSKNVTPIPYSSQSNHEALHQTLHTWSAIYRDGLSGKESIIRDYASLDPGQSTSVDHFQGRVTWALSDPSGVPARLFAEMEPVPPFSWLAAVIEPNWLRWKQHPKIQVRIHQWLIRHLDNPELALFLARRPDWKTTNLVLQINEQLKKIHKWETEDKTAELNALCSSSPAGNPRPAMRTFWRLFLADRIARSNDISFELNTWTDQVRRDVLTPSLRSSLREHLTPRVELKGLFRYSDPLSVDAEFDRVFLLEVILGYGHALTYLNDWSRSPRWTELLTELAYDFTFLLHDAMGLLLETRKITNRSDYTHIDHRAIASDREKGYEIDDWSALIKPTRDAFLALAARSPVKAEGLAVLWMDYPFPLFKRLAFFAATTPGVGSPEKALAWVLSDDGWWLFSPETEREMMDVIKHAHPKVSLELQGKLEGAILRGPKDEQFPRVFEPDRLQLAKDEMVLSRLTLMKDEGIDLLPQTDQARMTLAARYPDWRPEWSPEVQEAFRKSMEPLKTPEEREELKQWLLEHPGRDHHRDDDFDERCRSDFPTVVGLLKELANEGHWYPYRWIAVLSAGIVTEEDVQPPQSSWSEVAKFLVGRPDSDLLPIAGTLSWWLEAQAKHLPESENETFFALCGKMLDLDHASVSNDTDPIFNAINHPVGRIAEALLDHWSRKKLANGEGLPATYRAFFVRFITGSSESFQHGRILLSTRVVTLFLVDPMWTEEFLLPWFEWKRSADDARRAWIGFLRNARWLPSLMEPLKCDFMETARHYSELGREAHQYARLLNHLALRSDEFFSIEELRTILGYLPVNGLEAMASTMALTFSAKETHVIELWKHRAKPFFESVWPKSKEKGTLQLSNHLARLCVATGAAFPDALDTLKLWFQPGECPSAVIQKILEDDLASKYPAETLDFLDRIINTKGSWCFDDLAECLKKISENASSMAQDRRYRALDEFQRRHGSPRGKM